VTAIFFPLVARWLRQKGENEMASQQEMFTPVPESIDAEEIRERAVAISLELEGIATADAFKVLALAMARFTLGRESTKSAKEAAMHCVDDIADMAVQTIQEQG
jgi:hypothetical protein